MEPKIGEYGYDGSCAPKRDGSNAYPFTHFHTFSLGIFPWIAKKNGKPKKGKVVVRVVGPTAFPEKVYAKADELVAKANRGEAIWPPKEYRV